MAYGYPTDQLVIDLQNRMHDLFEAVGAPAPRWDEIVYRQAILEGLKWVEPVGEVRLVVMNYLSYGMTPQPDETLMEIKQVEITGARGLWATIPKQLWRFERGADRWLSLTYPMDATAVPPQTLRVTGIGRVKLDGIASPIAGTDPVAYPTTAVMVDVMMVELYAMSVLTERDTTWGAPSQTELDETHSMTFRAQAELRKQAVLFLQSPPPPPPPSGSSKGSSS